MNILYLIGNGFDVAQGLKTRYSDFYGTYKQSSPINEEERKIIASINGSIEKWSDLEIALGVFSREVKSAEGFIEAYESLSSKLSVFLQEQEGQYRPDNIERYRKELAHPFEDLSYSDAKSFYEYVSSLKEKSSADVISFNYTNVFERAIGYEYQELALEGPFFTQGISLNRVYKIHGSLQGTIVMGVNDASQIANDTFAKNQDVCDMIVKPQTNTVIGLGFDVLSEEMVSAADLIIVYGMSIGETDRIWWQRIGERLVSSPMVRLIIFYHLDEQIPADKGWRIGKIQRAVKERFESIAGISEELRDEVRKRMYVSTKGYMFNPGVVKFSPIQ